MKKGTGHILFLILTGLLLTAAALILWAGSKELPKEAAMAQRAMAASRRSDADRYLPERSRELQQNYGRIAKRWEEEERKWIWFRRYDPFIADFTDIIRQAEELETELNQLVRNRAADLHQLQKELTRQATSLRTFTKTINEGRLARRNLTLAELNLAQASINIGQWKLDQAERQLDQAETEIGRAQQSLDRVLGRYRSDHQIERWNSWIDQTVTESRRSGSMAVIISKIDKKLYLYRKGIQIRSFEVGLGRNGLSDKKHAGDNATPEGRYRISKKNPYSHYHKALLLNYPNEEDRQMFRKARSMGQIPPRVGIGSLIEIHGGGISYMTRGCIALENDEMDTLYQLLSVGTPVTIVGSGDRQVLPFPPITEESR